MAALGQSMSDNTLTLQSSGSSISVIGPSVLLDMADAADPLTVYAPLAALATSARPLCEIEIEIALQASHTIKNGTRSLAGRAGRAHVVQHFDRRKLAEHWVPVYEQIAATARR